MGFILTTEPSYQRISLSGTLTPGDLKALAVPAVPAMQASTEGGAPCIAM